MKIDIQKAYDTISWSFLESILTRFGFPQKMVHWIIVCVSTTAFTLCVNGDRFGYFKGGRGLRQGDPISPYILTLIMEVFTLIMKKHSLDSRYRYHWRCKQLQITHLCFADDLMVLCHGDINSVKVVKKVLDSFSLISDLNPNLGKSTNFFWKFERECKTGHLSNSSI